MKKKLLTVLSATALSLSMCIPAFAGQWVSNTTGWWWQNDDGSWPANSWQWLDGNKDGVSECYYFGQNGYLLVNTTKQHQTDIRSMQMVHGQKMVLFRQK